MVLLLGVPDGHDDIVTSEMSLGAISSLSGKNTDALEYHLKALKTLENTIPPESIVLIATAHDIVAANYSQLGRFEEALVHLNKALEIRKNNLHSGHPDYRDIALSYDIAD